ncbi:hypothetical protein K488DRAFT_83337 [Vararia minispora EC-137]|uniref:Uncharacterized protein n=1 Tax=Vararia minispora EC-137 TaxID=1314806 RepID=A0ACB8QUL4_9AGAM|nr:hypothetical protein K488DRAFT_83337 [Vararia minispora EC-137]
MSELATIPFGVPKAKRLRPAVTVVIVSLDSSGPPLHLPLMTYPQALAKPTHSSEVSALASANERRRVNPDSLAERLGPEVVAELERHIIPGETEMPPFSVRRDIQVKFGIDRRHIYDFYHSRGLRCLRNERAVQKKDDSVAPPELSRPRSSRGPIPNYTEPKRRRSSASPYVAPAPKAARGPRRSAPTRSPLSISTSSSLAHIQTRLDIDSGLPEDPPSHDSVDDPSAFSTDLSNFSSGPPSPVPSFLSESESISSCSTAASFVSPLTPFSAAGFKFETTSPPSSASISTCDGVETVDFGAHSLLSREEQLQPYSWLNQVLGPAKGIQECVGSYKQFMERQRNIYYEPFFDTDGLPAVVRSSPPESIPVVQPTSLRRKLDAAPRRPENGDEDDDLTLVYPSSSPPPSASAPDDRKDTERAYPLPSHAPPSLSPVLRPRPMQIEPVVIPQEVLRPPFPRWRASPLRPPTLPGEQVYPSFVIGNQDAYLMYQMEGAAVRNVWDESRCRLRMPPFVCSQW